MKKILFLLVIMGLAGGAWSQKNKDEIVYFEDSDVRQSRMSISILGNPNFTNRNLINDEIPEGGGLDLLDADTKGDFAFNYGLDVFYSLSSALDVGVGFGRSNAFYSLERARIYGTDSFLPDLQDTLTIGADFATNMWVLPIKLNFNTTISDLFDLEVIPTVSLIFPDNYTATFRDENTQLETDLSDFLRNLNWRVGISLGGTWYFADNLGFFVRANANYLLNSMIKRPGYPRETLYSVGADVGFKFNFL